MKYIIWIIACLIEMGFFMATAHAASLDDLYRDIIRSDNQGYLPLFVKNREEPNISPDASLAKASQNTSPTETDTPNRAINLINNNRQKEAQKKALQLKWEKTLKAIQENNVSPLDLEEIQLRVSQNDGQATEILAWMHTKGIGVAQDLPTAFILYRKAENLKVPHAKENAIKIYKAMTVEQRSKVRN